MCWRESYKFYSGLLFCLKTQCKKYHPDTQKQVLSKLIVILSNYMWKMCIKSIFKYYFIHEKLLYVHNNNEHHCKVGISSNSIPLYYTLNIINEEIGNSCNKYFGILSKENKLFDVDKAAPN